MSSKHTAPKPASAKKARHNKRAPSTPTTASSRQHKKGLHPRNQHAQGYDFAQLQQALPKLSHFVKPNPYGNLSIDFADPVAVRTLNAALLLADYGIECWDIPEGFLCPPVPGRVDYLHYLADLLQAKRNKGLRGLDIGTGANGIYPLLGIKAFGWNFVASDIDPISIANVQGIAQANNLTDKQLSLRLQLQPQHMFTGIIAPHELFDFTMCNPPFHRSAQDAAAGSARKVANLAANQQAKHGKVSVDPKASTLNFGGQKAELWCDGGEIRFLTDMINESINFAGQVKWFTSLVSKSENLKPCQALLKQHKAVTVKQIEMKQGQKITRILAWTFMNPAMMVQWQKLRNMS